jgi:biopolymer transport protein ExbD
MPKVKIPRKSTVVDMTAMCDVSFLLLTFFILTAQFRPQELAAIDIPVSRSTKEFKKAIIIEVAKDGKVFISLDETHTRYLMLNQMIDKYGDKSPNLKNLNDKQKNFFALIDTWGTPVEDINRVLSMNGLKLQDYQKQMPGVPFDSIHNQLGDWVQAARYATDGDIKIAIKGDKNANIEPVKQIVKDLTAKDIHRFLLVTTLAGGPGVSSEDNASTK